MPGGNAWEAVKALIVAKGFLERQIEELQAAASTGYSRGRYEVPRDRKIGTTEMEVTYYVALPFVGADDGIAAGEGRRVLQPQRRCDASRDAIA